jgi:hypothetical protein
VRGFGLHGRFQKRLHLCLSPASMPAIPSRDIFAEETDKPLYADERNFYKVEKWIPEGTKIDRLLYASSNLQKAHSLFQQAIKPLGEVDIVPAQITGFRNPKSVPVDQKPDQPVSVTVPVAPEGRKQLGHFRFCEVLAHPVGTVGLTAFYRTGRIMIGIGFPDTEDFR